MIVLIAAAALGAAQPTEAQRQLDDLRFMYEQSCGSRAYATFDDICDTLKKQMKTAERTAKKGGSKTAKAPVGGAASTIPAPQPAPSAPTNGFAN